MQVRILVFSAFLLAGTSPWWPPKQGPEAEPAVAADCPGTTPRVLFGLLARPLPLAEMVEQLERGCLALDEVRFRPGQDTIELLSPAQFALVARALGMARGAYRVAVPPEALRGSPPDTVQARRREMRLRDELLHYGASWDRLREDLGGRIPPPAVTTGAAKPMLIRVPDRKPTNPPGL